MTAPSPGNSQSTVAAEALPLPRRYWVVFAFSIVVALTVLDVTVINVALPAIARDLGISPPPVRSGW